MLREIMGNLCSNGFDKGATYRKKVSHVYCTVSCTLEELYNGVQKRIKFTDQRMKLVQGPVVTEPNPHPDTLVVTLPAGAKNGLRTFFPRRVLVEGKKKPVDVIVDAFEMPHPDFQRHGNDLWTKIKIPLVEYISKDYLTIETLDERLLTVPKIEPNCVLHVPNEGMPSWWHGEKIGCLFVIFEVIYPTNLSLSEEEKEQLSKLLGIEGNNA